ncbi:hypothetical protein Pyn_40711 [Prunus yedoensis var. nudiflora]|uniref:Uncharacterized protein n=1 Tax=Prunus yedoensis var. nudiflora TaxID=2094558 RepID=A0A314Z272_PRUYE|nr:hypothetical protein Pyn_40711 [Prunus yedoensis var. nudiflora]
MGELHMLSAPWVSSLSGGIVFCINDVFGGRQGEGACKCEECACVLVSHQRMRVWAGVLQPHQGKAPEREHGREGEWVACEMQASSPMNSWRMFQLEISWAHQRFKRGYISWGVTVSFGKYCEWVYKGLGFGTKDYYRVSEDEENERGKENRWSYKATWRSGAGWALTCKFLDGASLSRNWRHLQARPGGLRYETLAAISMNS